MYVCLESDLQDFYAQARRLFCPAHFVRSCGIGLADMVCNVELHRGDDSITLTLLIDMDYIDLAPFAFRALIFDKQTDFEGGDGVQ